ncbi:DEKNAAC105000 [Brettanomyces naardenensis]|uniref:DEKNAAC105000 n=1 Tax=Brettanomyces naardenensis TaxID=13370 RepID=A0A448YS67_BRENA|nr:DEKNAAC105000 [Brettanomyces naardenensis]
MYEHCRMDLDSAFAFSVDYYVVHAYQFLIKCYYPGDKIYLFGFSRGSFVCRILAGMIEKIGLLDKGLKSMVNTAWQIYQKWEKDGQPTTVKDSGCFSISEFKRTFCRQNVKIEFMGLWDSINSCGIIRDRLFPYASSSAHVGHVRHAVSINERRAKLKQNLFVPYSYLPSLFGIDSRGEEVPLLGDTDRHPRNCSDDLLEVWFPGDHSDVGGNWPPDIGGHELANVSFRWILSYAIEFGVLFKRGSVHEFAEKYTSLASVLSSHHDCLCLIRHNQAIHNTLCPKPRDSQYLFPDVDKLVVLPDVPVKRDDCRGNDGILRTLFWWFVEILPVGYLIENTKGKWRPVYSPNLGRSRTVPEAAKIHWSLIWRTKFVADYKSPNLPDIYQRLTNAIRKEENAEPGTSPITTAQLIDFRTGIINANCLLDGPIDIDFVDIPDDLSLCISMYPDL